MEEEGGLTVVFIIAFIIGFGVGECSDPDRKKNQSREEKISELREQRHELQQENKQLRYERDVCQEVAKQVQVIHNTSK